MSLRVPARGASLLSILILLALPSGVTRASALLDARPNPARALTADGVWAQFPTPARGGHTLVCDPGRGRMILFGGTDPILRNDLWWMPLDGSSGWLPLAAAGPRPSRRQHHTAVWDPLRDRMLVFGGDSGAVPFNDVWALSFDGPPTWQPLAPTGTPPSARSRHAAFYDPARDRMLVFGGNDGAPLADVWELSLAGTPAWNAIGPSGTPPAARYFHSMIYDPARDRAVVYGGQVDDEFNLLDDAWALTLSGPPAWSPIAPAGFTPPPRTAHRALYDPDHDGMVVFGGVTDDTASTLELLFAPIPSWITLPAPGEVFLGNAEHDVARDDAGHRMIVHGGRIDLIRRQNQTWAMDLASRDWSRLGPDLPTRRRGHTLVYDPAGRQAILYGGTGDEWSALPDAWSLPLGGLQTWSRLSAAGAPPGHWEHSAIVAPARGSMIVFGGDGIPGTSDVWEVTLGGTPAWSFLATSGTPPPYRSFHSAVYDAARDRMIVFGGLGPASLSDVWALTLSGTPTWAPLAPAGTPPSSRYDHAAIYDPVGDRMLAFGGILGSSPTNEVWALSFSPTPTWSLLAPSGTPPSARNGCAAAYDAARNRMLIFGDQGNHSDVWALNLSGSPAWTRLAPTGSGPLGREQAAAIYDVEGDRLVLYGGYWENSLGEPFFLGDTWTLAFGDAASVPAAARASRARLEPAIPNPATRSTTLGFSLPIAARARLEIYDLGGRRVRALRNEVLAAGPHSASWDLKSDAGARVPPGLYLCELRCGGDRLSRKILVVD